MAKIEYVENMPWKYSVVSLTENVGYFFRSKNSWILYFRTCILPYFYDRILLLNISHRFENKDRVVRIKNFNGFYQYTLYRCMIDNELKLIQPESIHWNNNDIYLWNFWNMYTLKIWIWITDIDSQTSHILLYTIKVP